MRSSSGIPKKRDRIGTEKKRIITKKTGTWRRGVKDSVVRIYASSSGSLETRNWGTNGRYIASTSEVTSREYVQVSVVVVVIGYFEEVSVACASKAKMRRNATNEPKKWDLYYIINQTEKKFNEMGTLSGVSEKGSRSSPSNFCSSSEISSYISKIPSIYHSRRSNVKRAVNSRGRPPTSAFGWYSRGWLRAKTI